MIRDVTYSIYSLGAKIKIGITGTVTNGGSLSGILASPFCPRFGETGVMLVFPPNGSWLCSSRAFRNQVMRYFGDQCSIDLRQPHDRLACQG